MQGDQWDDSLMPTNRVRGRRGASIQEERWDGSVI